ncbi:cell division protein PerM [Sphaerisporangium sp. NPDC004334]
MTALFDQLRAAPRTVLSRIPLAGSGDDDEARRPLPVSGMLAAAWTLGVGLAVLTTLTLIGWIAAPRGAFGQGLPGVFRAACQVWLAAHHAGFAIPGGRVGLLPIGLTVLPAALLYRAAIWMARDADLRLRLPARLPKGSTKDLANARRRAQLVLIAQAGISLAAPYALLAGAIALAAQNNLTQPSVGEALVSHLVLAFVAGSLATARTIGPWRSMLRLLPERARSVAVGTAVALSILLAAGLILVLVAVVADFGQVRRLSELLAPGFVGGALLLLVEVLYLFNFVIWGLAYISGPGFALGAGTLVAPTGVQLGALPALPILGALPDSGSMPPWIMGVLAVPFIAGAVAGVVVARVSPTPHFESAPLWGFVCGLATGLASGLLAALAGGPLGGARLAAVGPSAWEVALSVTLEVGVAAGISAGLANWWLVFHGATVEATPVRRAGDALVKVASRVKLAAPAPTGELPGHWMDATEADTQPIPVIRADWADEHASAAVETFDPAPVDGPSAKAPRAGKGPAGRRPTGKGLAGTGAAAGAGRGTARREEPRPPRRDIVDESDDRGGHIIYVDPYAWDRDS